MLLLDQQIWLLTFAGQTWGVNGGQRGSSGANFDQIPNSTRSKLARLLKNEDWGLKICTQHVFSMGKMLIAFILAYLKFHSLFGAPQGSKRGSKWSKIVRLLKNDDWLLKICTQHAFSMRKTMIAFIWAYLKFHLLFGAPQGSKRGSIGSKIARLLRNDDWLLKICTQPAFSMRKTMIAFIWAYLKFHLLFGAPQGSKRGSIGSKIARLLRNDDWLLKICTQHAFSTRKTIIAFILVYLKFHLLFEAPQGSKRGWNRSKIARLLKSDGKLLKICTQHAFSMIKTVIAFLFRIS
jgi:hypothetical protein